MFALRSDVSQAALEARRAKSIDGDQLVAGTFAENDAHSRRWDAEVLRDQHAKGPVGTTVHGRRRDSRPKHSVLQAEQLVSMTTWAEPDCDPAGEWLSHRRHFATRPWTE